MRRGELNKEICYLRRNRDLIDEEKAMEKAGSKHAIRGNSMRPFSPTPEFVVFKGRLGCSSDSGGQGPGWWLSDPQGTLGNAQGHF